MRHGVEAYLAEFAGELTEAPSRFATPSYSIPAPAPVPSPTVTTAGDLAPGSTALRPAIRPVVRLWLNTVEGWRGEMQEAGVQLAALQRDADSRRRQGVERRAEDTFVAGAVHLNPNYVTREFAVPRDGTCDLRLLTWPDVWMAAQAILRKLAAAPPVGTPGADIFAWVKNIHAARRLMFEATNYRSAFFDIVPAASGGPRAGVVYREGLASDAQAHGVYTRPTRPATVTLLDAMNYAPRPVGGYQELLGAYLTQQAIMWWTVKDVRFANADGSIETGIQTFGEEQGLAGEVELQTPADGQIRNSARALYTRLFGNLTWVQAQVALLWSRTSADSPYTSTRIADVADADRRRWRAYDVTVDVGAWIRNAQRYAAYFGDPRLSMAAVLERTTGFYLNSYLDYGAQAGLVPREDLAAAQAQANAIQARIQAELRTAVYTATGLMTAILSLIPVVGSIIGGVIAGVVALLVELGGAASGGAFMSPVLPLFTRVFAGSCRSSTWIEPPAPPAVPGTPAPAPAPAPSTPPDEDPGPSKGPAGIVIGAGALAFGFWLLSRSSR